MKTYQDYYDEWQCSTESRDLAFDEWLMLLLDRKEREMTEEMRKLNEEWEENLAEAKRQRDAYHDELLRFRADKAEGVIKGSHNAMMGTYVENQKVALSRGWIHALFEKWMLSHGTTAPFIPIDVQGDAYMGGYIQAVKDIFLDCEILIGE